MDINKHVHWDLPSGSVVKNLPPIAGDAEDVSLIPRSGRSSGEGNGNPLQHSHWENPMDRGAWWATVHGVSKEPGATKHTHKHVNKRLISTHLPNVSMLTPGLQAHPHSSIPPPAGGKSTTCNYQVKCAVACLLEQLFIATINSVKTWPP